MKPRLIRRMPPSQNADLLNELLCDIHHSGIHLTDAEWAEGWDENPVRNGP